MTPFRPVVESGLVFGPLLYAGAWVSFALVHSLLASRPMRRLLIARLGRGERLFYNAVALIHFGIVLTIGWVLLHDQPGFGFPVPLRAIMLVVSATGLIGIVVVLRAYDLGRFAGTTQWRTRTPDRLGSADEPLVTGGLHRYVRHPLYTMAILALWGGATAPLGLTTAVFGTAYLWIGLRFEERKLIAVYGTAYLNYREAVPSLVPFLARRAGR